MKASMLIVSFALLLGACASNTAKPTATGAATAIAEASAAERKVAAVGYEWRDTGTLIVEAKKAASEKDYAKAIKLAGQAERQSLHAWQQYKSQRNAADRY